MLINSKIIINKKNIEIKRVSNIVNKIYDEYLNKENIFNMKSLFNYIFNKLFILTLFKFNLMFVIFILLSSFVYICDSRTMKNDLNSHQHLHHQQHQQQSNSNNLNYYNKTLIKTYFTKALNEDQLENALKLFLEEWELRHTSNSNNNEHNKQYTLKLSQNFNNGDSKIIIDNSKSKNSYNNNDMQADYPSNDEQSINLKHIINDNDFLKTILSNSKINHNNNNNNNNNDNDQTQSIFNCTRCVLHGQAKQRRLEEIKNDILSKLGFEKVPNVTSKVPTNIPPINDLLDKYGVFNDENLQTSSVSSSYSSTLTSQSSMLTRPLKAEQYLSDTNDEMASDQPLYDNNNQNNKDNEDYFVNNEKAIIFSQKAPTILQIPNELKSQYFKFTNKVINSDIKRAQLWVHLKPKQSNHRNDLIAWIVIYQVSIGKQGDSPVLLLFKEKKVQINKVGNWIKLDIKKLVNQWIKNPNENLGLVIHSYDNDGNELQISSFEDDHQQQNMRTFIELYLNTRVQTRQRRMIDLTCEENSNEVRCCRYPLTVDFEEFGWDWIIAPKRYEANYCSGECPLAFLPNYAHTHVVQQKKNLLGSNGPCCAPKKMSSMSMIYYVEGGIHYAVVPSMVVERCGCS